MSPDSRGGATPGSGWTEAAGGYRPATECADREVGDSADAAGAPASPAISTIIRVSNRIADTVLAFPNVVKVVGPGVRTGLARSAEVVPPGDGGAEGVVSQEDQAGPGRTRQARHPPLPTPRP